MPAEKNKFLQIVKWLTVIIVAVIGLAMAANYFVRVPDQSGQKSTGILVDWFENAFKSKNLKNWENSANLSGLGMDILFRQGPAILDSSSEDMKNQKEMALSYFSKALEAAKKVDDSYLAEVHPQLPAAYSDYKKSLGLFIKGAKESDLEYFNQANSLYNNFISFVKDHYQDFKPLE